MQAISQKKRHNRVSPRFRDYLERFGHATTLPVHYADLRNISSSFPLTDKNGRDTYWDTLHYEPFVREELNQTLTAAYAMLKAGGDMTIVDNLTVDRIDYCTFGNSKPFRIRVINLYNDNYDHFYVKKADASRIYGLELEQLVSPNHVNYLVDGETLLEEHVVGIPGDDFISYHLSRPERNKVRLAKEFVKFNERCFVRLLGDMRSYNYVVDITPDIEDEQYRVRAMDFDQQSYEGKRTLYLPQFFKENNAVVNLVLSLLNPETVDQYRREERALMSRRVQKERERLEDLRVCMESDDLAPFDKVKQLRSELAEHHHAAEFLHSRTMGEIVFTHLEVCLFRPMLTPVVR